MQYKPEHETVSHLNHALYYLLQKPGHYSISCMNYTAVVNNINSSLCKLEYTVSCINHVPSAKCYTNRNAAPFPI